ncbi:tripartite tricarboxylate transporter substrate binding protein [Roseomonas sp. NAR14]|uniref:Tripartite tricarboxylate transporter substrate binding protein n=1 Tax=Roseomonas acroporae TaxID=2937791 RepID=A0A9X2BXM3_9PROT|nr:tripartite tricarboxylate transporter substrate binding protein [Roseomonas acroporae]MCK8786104.1 tripartite tricarboxylate transporter substrate binding protein [Roseomonas acroporae]
MLPLTGTLLLPAAARAQARWKPDHPVRIVIPFATGGASDILARGAAEQLSQSLGQPVVVEARPGAGGNLGAEAAARAVPDGHTVFFGGMSSNAINQALYTHLNFDPAADLVPIGMFIGIANVLLINPARHDFADLKAMIAEAKARPGALAYGSYGAGSVTHLTMELLCRAAGGIDLLHVPYRGSGPAAIGLLGGEIAMMFDGAPSAVQQVRAGTLRALGVSTAQRIEALPDVPSLAEAGVPGYDVPSWYAMFAPTGTPAPALERWRQELAALCVSPPFATVLRHSAARYMAIEGAAMEHFLAAERDRWAAAVRESGVRLD